MTPRCLFSITTRYRTLCSGFSSQLASFVSMIEGAQQRICDEIECEETSVFGDDVWESDRSHGRTRVLSGGDLIEKGSVSISIINNAPLQPERAAKISARQQIDIAPNSRYSAAALSLVLHSRSPLVPTFRSDVRIFSVGDNDFFGGGADITPSYLFEDDVKAFHKCYKSLCTEAKLPYEHMKESCDNYFFIPSRNEHRGVGGIFFDDLEGPGALPFVTNLANLWMASWLPMAVKRGSCTYTKEQREWQLLRRGRYLEFNLLYDRGVAFGLASPTPRVEGIMCSAPPLCAFEYKKKIREGSREEEMQKVLVSPRDWI